jgi:hypothetical protein
MYEGKQIFVRLHESVQLPISVMNIKFDNLRNALYELIQLRFTPTLRLLTSSLYVIFLANGESQ